MRPDGFAETAARLAGLVPATLGWTPDQFWAATPAELGAVLEAIAGAASETVSAAPLCSSELNRLKEHDPDG